MTRDEKREELALDAANFCALKGDPTHAAAIRWVVDSYRLALSRPATETPKTPKSVQPTATEAEKTAAAARLQDTTNALVWAEVAAMHGLHTDVGWLLSWFANAIEVGRREGERAALVERTCGNCNHYDASEGRNFLHGSPARRCLVYGGMRADDDGCIKGWTAREGRE